MIVFFRKHVANTLTMLNMTCGLLSIIFAARGQVRFALSVIILASILDRFDGKLARHFGTDSGLGVQLDSLADLLSFGVAPAMLVYYVKIAHLTGFLYVLSVAVLVFYVLAGGYRLARYNVIGQVEDCFLGLPITVAGLFIASLILFGPGISIFFFLLVVVLLAVFMISRVRIRKR